MNEEKEQVLSQEIAEAAAEATTETVAETAAEATPAEAPAEETAAEASPAAEKKAAEAPTETMADYEKQINASVKRIHRGDMLTGKIIKVADDELSIDLGMQADGVVRKSDASDDPDFTFAGYEVGQEITASVIRSNNSQGRIQLSLKAAAQEQGWERMQQLMEDQSNITVKIREAVKGGVITYVDGLRAFIPASKLSLNYVENLEDWVGKEIEVRVITADKDDKKRLVLSARDILREKRAAERAAERKNRIANMKVGFVTEGTVETIQPYGAFINLGNGISGLVHVSQISQKRIATPADVLKEGQTVKVKVIAVKDGKISLSMKALEDTPVEPTREETYKMPKAEAATTSLGDILKGIKLD